MGSGLLLKGQRRNFHRPRILAESACGVNDLLIAAPGIAPIGIGIKARRTPNHVQINAVVMMKRRGFTHP
jgi:hypothetical protein